MNMFASAIKKLETKSMKDLLINNAIYIVLVALFGTIVAIDPTFLNIKNFGFILSQSATRMIFACAIAGPIVLGGTDLSAGRLIGFAGSITASMLAVPDYVSRVFRNLPGCPYGLQSFGYVICGFVLAFHASWEK